MPPPGSELPDFPSSQLFLRRLAYSLVRDSAQAEDLVQDTWAAWVAHGPRDTGQPRAWLARVLRNRAFNLRRSDARRTRRESELRRPEASEPETDGTLEAQARLIEALRALEEPYRSTLVQRYYHDLAPSAIAERTGTPLNTVKARLARGLEKLRGALDKRYGGDRGAWCHWLTVLGSASVAVAPPSVPRGASPAVGLGGGALTTLGGGGSAALGGWLLLAGALVSALAWIAWRATRSAPVMPDITFETAQESRPVELHAPHREPVEVRAESGAVEAPLAPVVASAAPTPLAPALPFEWRQLGGTPTHDNYSAFVGRKDLILHPRLGANYPSLEGQPTIAGVELYAGGYEVYRLDLSNNKLSSCGREFDERLASAKGRTSAKREDWGWRLLVNGLGPRARVAAAPTLTDELVIVRLVADGSVSALDRDLQHELWHWEPSAPVPSPLSGCLVNELYLVAHEHEVVALRVLNGSVEWRFDTGAAGAVEMIPASDGDLVYFATVSGVVFAVDLARGREAWRVETERAYRDTYPLVLGDRVVLADSGAEDAQPWYQGQVRAFQSYDGRELWHASSALVTRPGVGPGVVFVADPYRGVVALALETGQPSAAFYCEQDESGGGAATLVDKGLFFVRGGLHVREFEAGAVSRHAGEDRWIFPFEVLDFLHTGDRVYVVTQTGLWVIADDPKAPPVPPGFVVGQEGERESQAGRKASRRR